MYNEEALRDAYTKGGSRGMWDSFMSTNKNAKRSSNGTGWQSVNKGTAPNNINEYKALQAELDRARRSGSSSSKPAPKPAPKPTRTPTPKPEVSPAKKPELRLAGSDEFDKKLEDAKKGPAVTAPSPDPAQPGVIRRQPAPIQPAVTKPAPKPAPAQPTAPSGGINYEKAPEYTPTKIVQETREEIDNAVDADYDQQVQRNRDEQLHNHEAGRDFTQEFTNRHINNARDIVNSRDSDKFNTASKYINRMENAGGVDLTALDKQTRMAPLYDEAKSELTNLNIFGDRYKSSRDNPSSWGSPGKYEGPKAPDLGSIGDSWWDKISSIGLD